MTNQSITNKENTVKKQDFHANKEKECVSSAWGDRQHRGGGGKGGEGGWGAGEEKVLLLETYRGSLSSLGGSLAEDDMLARALYF